MVFYSKNNHHAGRHVLSFLIISLILLLSSSFVYAVDIDTVRKEYMQGEYEKCAQSAKSGIIGSISEERGILLVKSLMALGRYEQAAREFDIALMSEPLSLSLLMLGHEVYLYNNEPAKAEEMYSPEVFGRSGSDWVVVE